MSIFTTIENDIKAAWTDIEGVVENDAIAAWNAFKGVFLKILPEQYTILVGVLTQIAADVESGDIADIETALLNKAETEELAWVKELGSEVLQAVIAIFQANQTVKAA